MFFHEHFLYLCIRYTVYVIFFLDYTYSVLSKTVFGFKNYWIVIFLNAFKNHIPDHISPITWISKSK